ncbi:armadillo-type protein [Scenedesmus sp. NREL 46B-D3]|nr:armadillo-type protein [Scenedesmus sp. NREL 46B-D3]
MPAVLELLELLLQQDKAAAVDAVKCDMLPALAAVYEHCCTSGTREAIDAVLLLLFKPPLVSALVSLPPAPAAGGGKGQASSRLTAIDSKPLAAAAGTAASMLPAALPTSSEAGQCLQHVQLELGRCCGTASVLAAMQLMSQGAAQNAELVPHLLKVLLAATSSQEARTAAHAHSAGLAAALKLATSAPTPTWTGVPDAPGESSATTAAASPASAAAAAAADLLVHIGQEKQIKPLLAQPLAQVLLQGGGVARVSAAWVASRLASCANEADKPAAKSAAEFCQALMAAGALPAVMDLLLSREVQCRAAGVALVSPLACFGHGTLHSNLLAAGAVPALVDVVRAATAGERMAVAATAALGALVAAAAPGAADAVCGLLVSCLQRSNPAVAANAAAALMDIAGASPAATSHLATAGAQLACLKLLQQCSSTSSSTASSLCLEAAGHAAQLLAWLLRSSGSAGTPGGSNNAGVAGTAAPAPAKPAACGAARDGSREAGCHTASSSPKGSGLNSSCSELLPGAVPVLLAALAVREHGVRLPAAAALGQLLRRPSAAADREAAVAGHVVTELLDVLRSSPAPAAPAAAPAAATDWAWDDAAAGLAALGALHGAAADDLARGLRQMALRDAARDAGTAAAVAASLAASPRGRAALLKEGILPGLVGVVGNPSCSPAARAAAADAIGALAVPASVVLDSSLAGSEQEPGRVRGAAGSASPVRGQAGRQQRQQHVVQPGARVVDPKLEAVRAGAVAALVGLLGAGAGPGCVLEAAEALYVLAGCQAGRDAALAAGAQDSLQDVVLAGKRREVAEKVATAAYDALMRFL